MSKQFKGESSGSMSVTRRLTGIRTSLPKHPRAHRTSCSCSSTTPAWRPGRPSVAKSRCRAWIRSLDNGLIYSQWHTAALCSPTRGMLLTGRNHHLNGNASITEGANGFPGQHARMPDECATVAQILQDAGWGTFWVGKNHNVPETDVALGSTKKQWPLAKGFDRFYGFIGGETNQFYPDLIADNHPVEQPYVEELSPLQGPGRPGDSNDQGPEGQQPFEAVVHVVLPGRQPRPAPNPGSRRNQDYRRCTTASSTRATRPTASRYWTEMIKKDILPEGTQLTPLNPLEGRRPGRCDVANEGDSVRPWDTH